MIKITTYLLWLASLGYWGAFAFQLPAAQEESHAILKSQLSNLLSPKINFDEDKQLGLSVMPGLFGQLDPLDTTAPKKISQKTIIFGPTGLQGTFINNNRVWAIVSSRNHEATIIQPKDIQAFNKSSITINTQSGVKSLHLKSNKQGIHIQATGSHAKELKRNQKPELSRAQTLRLKLLNSVRKKTEG